MVFAVLGTVVFSVTSRISREMSASAIQNLSESLDLLKGTLEALLHNEAEFQQLVAREIAASEDPEGYIRAYEKNETMVKISLIRSGAAQEGSRSTLLSGLVRYVQDNLAGDLSLAAVAAVFYRCLSGAG